MNDMFAGKLSPLGITPIGLPLVLDFHESTKGSVETDYIHVENVSSYLFQYRGKIETASNKKNYFSFPKIELPEPSFPDKKYGEVIAGRKSVRNFRPNSMSLKELSAILKALKVNRKMVTDDDFNISMTMRPYPSPGGLYPSEIYIVLNDVEDCERNVCHYDADNHCLTIIDKIEEEKFWTAVGQRGFSDLHNAAICILITSIFERTVVKYGPLGYRFALLEAGILSQQLCLSAAANDRESLVWGGYFDEEANAILHIDGHTETVTSCVFVGSEEAS